MTNTSTEASPAALVLKLHVNGPGGPICSVSLDAASKLDELKAAIADSSGIPSMAQRLFHGTEELGTEGTLAGLLPQGAVEEELLLVRRSPSEVAELVDASGESSDEDVPLRGLTDARGRRRAFSGSMFRGLVADRPDLMVRGLVAERRLAAAHP